MRRRGRLLRKCGGNSGDFLGKSDDFRTGLHPTGMSRNCRGCREHWRYQLNPCAWKGGYPTAHRAEHLNPKTGAWETCGEEDAPNGPECSLCGGSAGHYGECK